MTDCIFCKIIKKEIPGKIIYEDELCLAFLDSSQTTKGHTLVIPKTHAIDFLEVEPTTLQHMITITQTLAKKLKTSLQATGCNILTNAGVSAGQTVMHFHMHIIPRYNETDSIDITFTNNSQIYDLENVFQTIQQ